MRKCTICGQEKEECAFIHDKYAKGGIRNVCRECNKKRAQKRRNNYKQHIENLENQLKMYEITIIEENHNLKKLLKSFRKQINEDYEQLYRINDCPRTTTAYWQIESAKIGLKDVINQIDNALGEKK